ncbi:MAG: DUF924 family protein [Rhodospirillales bacterium]|jgi:uncharacterized protein (DUF924 family)|nr:DUF924 family protein [Rhodospirillales bacterium]MDP6883639.1 DUF924 family protein [Rhodospirillales bacterium]
MEAIALILDFWFVSDGLWFKKDDAFDETIRQRFTADYERAAAGESSDWRQTPDGCLALIILLDQFPRNMFRGSARAFATDALAIDVTEAALGRGFDNALPPARRRFVYMPLMHAEDVDHQRRCVDLFAALENDSNGLEYAIKHLEIIERFGRFPHRNEVLGRHSTPEELAFLKTPGSSF